jgi:hypothetical protein
MESKNNIFHILIGVMLIYMPPVLPLIIDPFNITRMIDPNLLPLLLGDLSLTMYKVCFIFAYLAISLKWSYDVYVGVNSKDNGTSTVFDLKYFMADNTPKIAFFLICSSITMIICLRVPQLATKYIGQTGADLGSVGFAIVIALAWEKIAYGLKNALLNK